MVEMYNTHYNLIDTLIYLDPKNWNLALAVVHEAHFKDVLGIGYDLVHEDHMVLEIAQEIMNIWNGEHGKFSGPYSATLADCAIFAVTQGYRHERI